MTVVIFSRPVRSGKTTELQQWCVDIGNVGGILMPDREGVRFFQDIETGESWPALAHGTEEALEVGRFRFSAEAFRRASRRIALAADQLFVVIDEIGKLELEGLGFASVLRSLLESTDWPRPALLLVVRDTLLEPVREAFGLEDAFVVHDLDEI